MLYNLIHGRIRSISAGDYRAIFGEEPPEYAVKRVDGQYFRGMVRLWLFLDSCASKVDLYGELYPGKRFRKVDHRIFNGQVRSVEARLEEVMEGKFLDQGLQRSQILMWIDELNGCTKERVPYRTARPALKYLEMGLGVSPSHFLKQRTRRYESGELSTISKKLYDRIEGLRRRAENVLGSGSQFDLLKLREDIFGRREGLVLYADIREELVLLKEYGRKSPRRYLGRSICLYERMGLKRVAAWRAARIREDAAALLRRMSDVPLSAMPRSYGKMHVTALISALRRVAAIKSLSENTGLEKTVLSPTISRVEEFRAELNLLVMEESADHLGMSRRAFDLMVASNSQLFRRVGIYDGRWHLPVSYLDELLGKRDFYTVRGKYEFLAKCLIPGLQPHGSRHAAGGVSPTKRPRFCRSESAISSRAAPAR
jgi:hypothetical protein